ncbi:MAG: hypothetical protein DRP01_01140 [Archaeoglobales archaeon]|nr:MAG: hypothetical protein DRP01_01140 [Archaeoglobales archaeon]
MSEERRIEVIVRWLEQNKEVGEKLVSQLNAIRANLETLGQTAQNIQKTLIYGFGAVHDQLLRTKRASKETEEATASTSRGFENLGKRISILGWRLSWMAYRLMMMGRIVMRWMVKPVNFAINTLTNWERSLDTVATSMGLLAVAGQLTGERQEYLQETLEGLAEQGPKVQGAFLYFQSALIGLVVQAGEPLAELFYKLGDLLRGLAPIVRETVLPALNELLSVFVGFLPTLKEIAVSAIPPVIQGLRDSIPVYQAVLGILKPFVPFLAKLAGAFAPLAPLLMGLGTALYFVTPLLQLFGSVISHLPKILGVLRHPISALKTAFDFLRGGVGGLINFFKGPFRSGLSSVAGALSKLGSFIKSGIVRAVGALGSAFSFLAAHPMVAVVVAIMAVVGALVYLYNTNENFRKAVNKAWETIKNAVLGAVGAIQNAFRGFLDWIESLKKGFLGFASSVMNLFGGIISKTDEFRRSQRELGNTVSELYEHSIGKTIARDLSCAIESVREAQNVFSRADLSIGASITPRTVASPSASPIQYISISAPITIESISSSMDLDEVSDAVTDAISEAVREVMG